MLHIVTNKYTIKSTEGGATLATLKPYRVVFVPHVIVPPYKAMSAANEVDFDAMMAGVFDAALKVGPSFSREAA